MLAILGIPTRRIGRDDLQASDDVTTPHPTSGYWLETKVRQAHIDS